MRVKELRDQYVESIRLVSLVMFGARMTVMRWFRRLCGFDLVGS